ncbi:hypothetical protein ACFU8X_21405, partial [Brevibacillus porteri]|uniref:hypothetical protein n=1 Tax=Brevibacillus porteri TaxID=2126350 RepID=UPI00370CD315
SECFLLAKTIHSGCKSTQMKLPRFCVLSAFIRIIKAIERTTADSMTYEREREWQFFLTCEGETIFPWNHHF